MVLLAVDSFSRASSSNLNTGAPTFPVTITWTEVISGTFDFSVSSNELLGAAGASDTQLVFQLARLDSTLSATTGYRVNIQVSKNDVLATPVPAASRGKLGVAVRLTGTGPQGYALIWALNGGTSVALYRMVTTHGESSQVLLKISDESFALGEGDILSLETEGTSAPIKLRGYVNRKLVVSAEDSTHTALGKPGILMMPGNPYTAFPNIYARDFSVESFSVVVPTAPKLTTVQASTISTLQASLSASEAFHPQMPDAGSEHLDSQWQIATDSAFTSIFLDTGFSASYKTSIIVSGLATNTTYFARTRYRSSNLLEISPWSGTATFSTPTMPSAIPTMDAPPFPQDPPPSYVQDEEAEFLTTVTQMERKSTTTVPVALEQRSITYDKPRRTFSLRYDALTQFQADALWAHYQFCRGREKMFTFIRPITNEAITCRYELDVISKTEFDYFLTEMGLRLLEVK